VIIGYMQKNIATAKEIIKMAVTKIPAKRECECPSALETAIVTAPTVMSLQQKKKFNLLIGKYVG
jgi:5'-methylthioadenosine phosphorylase